MRKLVTVMALAMMWSNFSAASVLASAAYSVSTTWTNPISNQENTWTLKISNPVMPKNNRGMYGYCFAADLSVSGNSPFEQRLMSQDTSVFSNVIGIDFESPELFPGGLVIPSEGEVVGGNRSVVIKAGQTAFRFPKVCLYNWNRTWVPVLNSRIPIVASVSFGLYLNNDANALGNSLPEEIDFPISTSIFSFLPNTGDKKLIAKRKLNKVTFATLTPGALANISRQEDCIKSPGCVGSALGGTSNSSSNSQSSPAPTSSARVACIAVIQNGDFASPFRALDDCQSSNDFVVSMCISHQGSFNLIAGGVITWGGGQTGMWLTTPGSTVVANISATRSSACSSALKPYLVTTTLNLSPKYAGGQLVFTDAFSSPPLIYLDMQIYFRN